MSTFKQSTTLTQLAQNFTLITNCLAKLLYQQFNVPNSSQLKQLQPHYAELQLLDTKFSLQNLANLCAELILIGLWTTQLTTTQTKQVKRPILQQIPATTPLIKSLINLIAHQSFNTPTHSFIAHLTNGLQTLDLQQIILKPDNNQPFLTTALNFYEVFLATNQPQERHKLGVWYTPKPVVNFIITSLDEVLKSEFGLAAGIADTSYTNQQLTSHKVHFFDPATGTGTFLNSLIQRIQPQLSQLKNTELTTYIETHLIPRLHGQELMPSAYQLCAMYLAMQLATTGYQPSNTAPNFNLRLTNSLASAPNLIDTPIKTNNKSILCVLGNPPYASNNDNNSTWITDLLAAYKQEPAQAHKLKERNLKWLNDDYVKFIRLGEHLINQQGAGVLALITNHGYLDNPTFRGMRWHLMQSFDKIYLLDLHGNSKKSSAIPKGIKDANVFDIQQGVAILIAIKHENREQRTENREQRTENREQRTENREQRTENREQRTENFTPVKSSVQVFHAEILGTREHKYATLENNSLASLKWQELQPQAPHFAFIPRNNSLEKHYLKGFALNEFMPVNSVGIVTARDKFTLATCKHELNLRLKNFSQLPPEVARTKYALGKDVRDWQVAWAQQDVRANLQADKILPLAYRPFETRWTLYTGNSRGFMCYPRTEVMQHLLQPANLALAVSRQHKASQSFHHVLVHQGLVESGFISNKTGEICYSLPLYLYEPTSKRTVQRKVNFNSVLLKQFLQKLNTPKIKQLNELEVFDYIYAVLHSPTYRATYADFLKYDFPRIPWPHSKDEFKRLSALGMQLRELHLHSPNSLNNTVAVLLGKGTQAIEKVSYKNEQIWINTQQYFDQVSVAVWNFNLGGYKPAQKWLNDRKNMTLNQKDIKTYQGILFILEQTLELMNKIALTQLKYINKPNK